MNAMTRSSGLLAVTAWCDTCRDTWDSRNAMGVAAQHARRTGHTVYVEQTISVIFNRGTE